MIRKVSKKKSKKQREQKKVYAAIKEERYGFCTGCGRSDVILDNSHLLSQKHYPQYQNEAWNLKFHCRERCHNYWESNLKRHLLLDYQENLDLILAHDEKAYNQLVGLMELKKLKFKV